MLYLPAGEMDRFHSRIGGTDFRSLEGSYFNNGQIALKAVVQCFEQMFSVDLGNYNRTYRQFFYRKKGEVFFLHKLAADTQKRIDDEEERRSTHLR